jgi:hypothetical protein
MALRALLKLALSCCPTVAQLAVCLPVMRATRVCLTYIFFFSTMSLMALEAIMFICYYSLCSISCAWGCPNKVEFSK